MIVRNPNYMLLSGVSNDYDYWDGSVFPEWAGIKLMRYFPGQIKGSGVEPHYHDGDEIWLFISGRGEVWLDGQSFEITPNTAVYTPMGVVHRFQAFTDFDNLAIVTRLERQKRDLHLLEKENGPPVPTVPGFVVRGDQNDGPFPDRGSRSPLSELRLIALQAGDGIGEGTLSCHEYWVVAEGTCDLCVEGFSVELSPGDAAVLRAGSTRQLRSTENACLVVARE